MGMEFAFVWRLAVAVLLGGLLGLERSLAGKHAGMRTYALVSLGSALFTVAGILATYQFSMLPAITPLQLAGFVIVGIGFIGSGLALSGINQPPEITTSAGIWVAAGMGIAAGFGYEWLALSATVLAILVFAVLSRLERHLLRRFGERYHKHQ